MVAPATFKWHQRPSMTTVKDERLYVNTFHGIGNSQFQQYNSISKVNAWTVNEDWLFGQMWLNGVHSVTSNNPLRF